MLSKFPAKTYRLSENNIRLVILSSVGREHEDLMHGDVSQPDVVFRVDGHLKFENIFSVQFQQSLFTSSPIARKLTYFVGEVSLYTGSPQFD